MSVSSPMSRLIISQSPTLATLDYLDQISALDLANINEESLVETVEKELTEKLLELSTAQLEASKFRSATRKTMEEAFVKLQQQEDEIVQLRDLCEQKSLECVVLKQQLDKINSNAVAGEVENGPTPGGGEENGSSSLSNNNNVALASPIRHFPSLPSSPASHRERDREVFLLRQQLTERSANANQLNLELERIKGYCRTLEKRNNLLMDRVNRQQSAEQALVDEWNTALSSFESVVYARDQLKDQLERANSNIKILTSMLDESRRASSQAIAERDAMFLHRRRSSNGEGEDNGEDEEEEDELYPICDTLDALRGDLLMTVQQQREGAQRLREQLTLAMGERDQAMKKLKHAEKVNRRAIRAEREKQQLQMEVENLSQQLLESRSKCASLETEAGFLRQALEGRVGSSSSDAEMMMHLFSRKTPTARSSPKGAGGENSPSVTSPVISSPKESQQQHPVTVYKKVIEIWDGLIEENETCEGKTSINDKKLVLSSPALESSMKDLLQSITAIENRAGNSTSIAAAKSLVEMALMGRVSRQDFEVLDGLLPSIPTTSSSSLSSSRNRQQQQRNLLIQSRLSPTNHSASTSSPRSPHLSSSSSSIEKMAKELSQLRKQVDALKFENISLKTHVEQSNAALLRAAQREGAFAAVAIARGV